MAPHVESSALRAQILEELHWDAAVDATRLDVQLLDRAAILTGAVRTYAEKRRAESLVKRMHGIAAVRNRIEVRLTIGDYRTDETLLRLITDVLQCLAGLPEARPKATVLDGWVTLSGVVPRAYQKRLAEEAVAVIAGVRGITNSIRVEPSEIPAPDLELNVGAALRRRLGDPSAVSVTASKGKVILRGTVHSCAERDELVDLVWSAAGVNTVVDRVEIE